MFTLYYSYVSAEANIFLALLSAIFKKAISLKSWGLQNSYLSSARNGTIGICLYEPIIPGSELKNITSLKTNSNEDPLFSLSALKRLLKLWCDCNRTVGLLASWNSLSLTVAIPGFKSCFDCFISFTQFSISFAESSALDFKIVSVKLMIISLPPRNE